MEMQYIVATATANQTIPECIDAARTLEDGSIVGAYSGKTREDLEAQYGRPMAILGSSDFQRMQEDALRTEPTEITEKQYMDALEVLPPMKWGKWLGVESFRMCEFYSGNVTNIYAKCGDRYWTFLDNAYMSGEDIAHKVGRAMQKTQH